MPDRTTRRFVLILISLLLALCMILLLVTRDHRKPEELPEVQRAPAPVAVDTAGSRPVAQRPVAPDTLPLRTRPGRAVVIPPPLKPLPPDTLRADLEVYEFIRDFYADVHERTVTVYLTEARLDTAGPLRWMFRRGLTGGEISTVKQFVVTVDSVRPLRKYIFPGWRYGSDWAPLPDGSIGLEGKIDPGHGTSRLTPAPGSDRISGTVEKRDDRLSIHLRSVAGYTYVIRFGVEYAGRKAEDSSGVVFTRAETVEFPLVLRCGSLAGDVKDTLYIATTDPLAIHEVAASVPNAPVVAVLLDADPDADWTKKDLTSRPDVSVFLNNATAAGESFIILNGSKALVERRVPDPSFDRVVRTHLEGGMHGRDLIEDDPARPVLRRTDLLTTPEAVAPLLGLFREYVRASVGHM